MMPMDESLPRILVLTPVKNAAKFIDGYFAGLLRLDYPRQNISVALLESDSTDGTEALLHHKARSLAASFRRISVFKRDYGFAIPPGVPRWSPAFQYPRRVVLAKSRNYLLSRALDDEDYVLWLDADVIHYPADVLQRLLALGRSIVTVDCVTRPGGPSFDTNAWAKKGTLTVDKLRGLPSPQRLDTVGATLLLVAADLHREGLVFPPFAFGERHPAIRDQNPCLPEGRAGEVESEGLGIMALAMGHQPWAATDIEILHAPE